MILSGKEIHARIGKDIVIDPYDVNRLNPNSYNLRLHNELLVYTTSPLDMKAENPHRRIPIPETGLVLNPDTL